MGKAGIRRALCLVALVAISGCTLNSTGASAPAQINDPAEVPPASYTEKQYVDSKGCVFIRSGEGERVIWVPRLTRSREQFCGFEPSLKEPIPEELELEDPNPEDEVDLVLADRLQADPIVI